MHFVVVLFVLSVLLLIYFNYYFFLSSDIHIHAHMISLCLLAVVQYISAVDSKDCEILYNGMACLHSLSETTDEEQDRTGDDMNKMMYSLLTSSAIQGGSVKMVNSTK